MIIFIQGVNFESIEDDKWKNLKPFNYKGVVIPAGFKTDFRTTPKWAEWLVKKVVPKYHLAFVLHDYIYQNQELFDLNRYQADIQTVYHLSKDLKEYQVVLTYIFIRLFGNYYWKKYKE